MSLSKKGFNDEQLAQTQPIKVARLLAHKDKVMFLGALGKDFKLTWFFFRTMSILKNALKQQL